MDGHYIRNADRQLIGEEECRKCVISIVCVKLGKLYAVKHNCVTCGVFNDYIMDNYMFRPVLAIFRVS